jgi:hypothetical protein
MARAYIVTEMPWRRSPNEGETDMTNMNNAAATDARLLMS